MQFPRVPDGIIPLHPFVVDEVEAHGWIRGLAVQVVPERYWSRRSPLVTSHLVMARGPAETVERFVGDVHRAYEALAHPPPLTGAHYQTERFAHAFSHELDVTGSRHCLWCRNE